MHYKIYGIILIITLMLVSCKDGNVNDNIELINVVENIPLDSFVEINIGEISKYDLYDEKLFAINMKYELFVIDINDGKILESKSFDKNSLGNIDTLKISKEYIVFCDDEYLKIFNLKDFELNSSVKIGSKNIDDIDKILLIDDKVIYYNSNVREINCYNIKEESYDWRFKMRNDISVTTDMLFYDNALYVRQLGDDILNLSIGDGTIIKIIEVTQTDDEKVRVSGESYYLTGISDEERELQLILDNWVSGLYKQCADGTMYSIWKRALSYYDINRKLVWTKELPIRTPFVDEYNNYLFISDRQNSIIIVDLLTASIICEYKFKSASYVPFILSIDKFIINDSEGNLRFYGLDNFQRLNRKDIE